MNFLLRFSFRYFLIGVLIGFALLTGTCTYLMTRAMMLRHAESEARNDMQAKLTHLQRVVQLLLRTDNLTGTRSIIAALESAPDHELTFLTDADGRILAATHRDWLGMPWQKAVLPRDRELIGRFANSQGHAEHVSEDGQSLSGYVDVCGSQNGQGIPSLLCGFLYSRTNIVRPKMAAIAVLRNQAIEYGISLAVSAAVLWVLFHLKVTRRITHLITATQRFAAGDDAASAGLQGDDELARIGNAFDQMIQTIANDRRRQVETNRFLQSTLDALTTHVAILDETGTILAVNAAWNQFAREHHCLGAVPSVGVNYLHICDLGAGKCSEAGPAIAQSIRQVITRKRDHVVLQYTCRNSEAQRWFLLRITHFESSQGPRVVVAHEDVTEREFAEEALQTSEAALDAKTESLTMLNTIADTLYRPLDFPSMAARAVDTIMAHLPTAAVAISEVDISANESSLIAERGLPKELTRIMQRLPIDCCLTGLTVQQQDVMISNDLNLDENLEPQMQRILAANGFTQLIAVPLLFQNRVLGVMNLLFREPYALADENHETFLSIGKTIGLALANAQYVSQLEAEINERKQAEDALRQSEEQYRILVEGSIQGISIINHTDLRVFANTALARILGYNHPEDLIGMHVLEGVSPDSRAMLQRYRKHRSCGDTEPIQYEYQRYKKDGTLIWIEQRLTPVVWEGETAYMVTMVDITERKQAEAALQQTNEELERRVQERTVELSVANEEVRRFAYIVSHDLRAPLINLKGFARELACACEGLKKALPRVLPHLDAEQREEVTRIIEEDGPEALAFIDSSVTRMDNLILAVLKLSRAGHRELHIEPIDTVALVQEVMQSMTYELTQQQIHVTLGPLPEIRADRTSMEQIFSNLLNNAIRYLKPGRPGEISVTAEQGADFTTFHVHDNGVGIAHADIPRIFDLFCRVGPQDTPGEGMGLTYVQTLVRRHGGEVQCRSEVGVGTTFSLTISTRLT